MDLNQLSDADLQAAITAGEALKQSQPAPDNAAPQAPPIFGGDIDTKLGNMSRAASQNLITGLQTASVQPGLFLRDITDSLGITDPQVSQNIRDVSAQQQAMATAKAQELGAPGAGTFGKVLGEAAPAIAQATAGYGAGKAILGAGRLADTAASAIGSAVPSLLQDTNGDMAKRLGNAGIGAVAGGIIGGAANVIGSAKDAVKPLIFGKADPDKVAAFAAAGIQPRASQIISKEVSPRAQRFWEGVETTLNKIPLFGIQNKVRNSNYKYVENAKKIVEQIDQGHPDPSPLFQQVAQSANPTKAYTLNGIQQAVKDEINHFSTNPALKRNPEVMNYIQQLTGLKNMTFKELHEARMGIDSAIDGLKRNLSNPATRQDFMALTNIRKSVSNGLEYIARDQHFIRPYLDANKAYTNRMFADAVVGARDKAMQAGGELFNAKSFNTALAKNLDELKNTYRIDIPPNDRAAIQNLKKLSDLFTADKVKPVTPGLNVSAAGAGTMALAGASGVGYAAAGLPGAAVSGALLRGLSLLSTTRAGLNLITNVGKVSGKNPKVRQLAAAAIALHFAEQAKTQKIETQQTLQGLSDEELQAAIQQGEALRAQQGGQQ